MNYNKTFTIVFSSILVSSCGHKSDLPPQVGGEQFVCEQRYETFVNKDLCNPFEQLEKDLDVAIENLAEQVEYDNLYNGEK